MIPALFLLAAALPVSIAVSSLVFFPLLAVYLLGAKWTFPRWPPTFGATEKAFLIFWVISLVSAMFGESLAGSRRGLTKDLYFSMAVLISALAVAPGLRWRLLHVFLYGSGAMALLGLVQYALGINQTEHHSQVFLNLPAALQDWPPRLLEYLSMIKLRAVGTRSHPITYAEGLLLGLAAAFGAWRAFPERRMAWGVISLALMGGVLVSLSRGPWLVMAIMVLLAVLLLRQRHLWLMVGLGSLILSGIFWNTSSMRQRLSTLSDATFQSNAERLRMWEAGWAMIQDNPWLGVGPGHVRRVVPQYQSESDRKAGPWGHLHNTFIHMAAERGIPALLAFLFWMALLFRASWKGWKSADLQVSGLGLAGMLAMVAFLACGMTERVYGDTEIMMMFFFLLGTSAPSPRFNTITPR